jgi:hypothetical protein
MNEQTNEWMDGRMNKQTNGQTKMDRRMYDHE